MRGSVQYDSRESESPQIYFLIHRVRQPAEHSALSLIGPLASRALDSCLGRRGWSRHTLSRGDKVSIAYRLLKDHRPGGFYVRIKLLNGLMMEVLPQRGGYVRCRGDCPRRPKRGKPLVTLAELPFRRLSVV
jgi:hypothetical protein